MNVADAGSLPAGERRSRSAGAVVFDLVMLAFVALIVVTALGIRPGARLVPLSVGLPTLALLLLQLVVDLRGPAPAAVRHAALVDTNLASASIGEMIEAARDEEVEEIAGDAAENVRREILFAGWTVAYIVLGFLTNFLVATPIAVGAILLVTRVQPVLALALAGATGLGVWIVFDLFLQVRF